MAVPQILGARFSQRSVDGREPARLRECPIDMPKPHDHAERMARIGLALDGLSVGDAFGERFFRGRHRDHLLDDEPYLPDEAWLYSDDTEMALAIGSVLDEFGEIERDALAATFARRFAANPSRGYGPGAVRLLSALCQGGDWRLESKALFSGNGSFGNGSAMRVAPVGAYFAGDGVDPLVAQARRSAEITHRHPEGIAGAIATAAAAAYAWEIRERRAEPDAKRGLLLSAVAATPDSEVREGLSRALEIPFDAQSRTAAGFLGNGKRVSCPDTVPFCLWNAAKLLDDYGAAIWETIRVGGDMDTNAAIVGGIVVLATGIEGIPPEWLARREPLANPASRER